MAGMKPLEGVRITLVTDAETAPYSGMLPGHVAGFYSTEEAHIDLRRLAGFAGARFVKARVVGLNAAEQRLHLEGRPSIRYDQLSINVGSTPMSVTVPGARRFAVSAKPVGPFLERWNEYVGRASKPAGLAVVGGGAGGVELSLSARARLGPQIPVRLIQKGPFILPSHNPKVRVLFEQLLKERSVEIRTGDPVVEVNAEGVVLESGVHIEADLTTWVTDASAPAWIAESGLAVDDRGFLLVSEELQSHSHPTVFGAGDVATMKDDPRPKSGVFAVRMAKPLWENLRRSLSGRPLRPFRPQKNFLSLIGTGDGEAIASRGALASRGAWLWRLKDRIDRKFMAKFEDLPKMDELAPVPKGASQRAGNQINGLEELRRHATMRCLGCAAKVGASVLSGALSRLRASYPGDGLLADDEGPEDAFVTSIPEGTSLVQTVDYMPTLISDPWLFGRIAALHSLSDLFAMGAEADSVLALVLVPFASDEIIEEDLFQALAGVVHELDRLGLQLGGGHTAEGSQLALGLTCNGHLPAGELLRKGALREGDQLILTKALGTGTIFATDMRGEAPRGAVAGALESMLRPNAEAGRIFREHGSLGCTDVTGFGLVGHLAEMLRPSGLTATLQLDQVPLLQGAPECARKGHLSSLQNQNAKAASVIANPPQPGKEPSGWPLLFDPQTSGGLLGGINPANVDACLDALRQGGDAPVVIGEVGTKADGSGALIRIQ